MCGTTKIVAETVDFVDVILQALDLFEMYKKHGISPKAREIRSMLHVLSKSKEHEKGERWEESLALLREAQEMELRLTEVSYNTGVCIVRVSACLCLYLCLSLPVFLSWSLSVSVFV